MSAHYSGVNAVPSLRYEDCAILGTLQAVIKCNPLNCQ